MVQKPKINIHKVEAYQQYAGEVDTSIIVVLQITSVYCVPSMIEIG